MALNSSLSLSICIVTRNRPESLCRCLESFSRQVSRDFVLFVSDDSEDAFKPRVTELCLAYNAIYIEGPRRGLYANRNQMALMTGTSHVLSSDDDHEHPVDYVSSILEAIELYPESVLTVGEVYNTEDLKRKKWTGPGVMTANGSLADEKSGAAKQCFVVADGSTVYPSSLFGSGVRFYEGFRFGDAYKEFSCLINWMGWHVRRINKTGVLHHIGEVGRSFAEDDSFRAANYFAVFMYSFFYQRSVKNMVVALITMLKSLIRSGPLELAVIITSLRHTWIRVREINSLGLSPNL